MKETRAIMGMPIEVEIVGTPTKEPFEAVFRYLTALDERFSTYKEESEISRLNKGEIALEEVTEDMKEIFSLAEKTKKETQGFFDIQRPDGYLDPSGIVKGWAVHKAARLLEDLGCINYFINA